MTLLDIKNNLKMSYNSDEDDILNNFLIPCFTNSTKYRRLTGFFSSNALAIAARGIAFFVKNGGKIEIIVSPKISKKDWEVIKNPESVTKELEEEFLKDLKNLEQLAIDHLKMLGWMIKTGKLEIKFAILSDSILGMHHQKMGIFEDNEGNLVSFKGSCNETHMGWIENIEDFEVFVSWNEEDERRIIKHLGRFEKFWLGQTERTHIFTASKINEILIEMAPDTEEEFNELSSKATEELIKRNRERLRHLSNHVKNKMELRPYQREAKEVWFENGGRGILKMATGTGKTAVAIKIIEEFISQNKSSLIVVAVPTQLLVAQWKIALQLAGHDTIIEIMGNSNVWDSNLKSAMLKCKIGRIKEVIAVSTYDALCSDKLINSVQRWESSRFLIGDEMHHAWAPQYRKGLSHEYGYRLGLSATPERYMDDNGTIQLQNYFGGVIFDFEIADAIPDYLVPYKYHAEVVRLTRNEKEEYENLTRAIARKIAANNGDIEEALPLILRRAKLVINSESKWVAFETILDGISDIKNTLIYCSDRQINRVKEMLHKRKIYSHEITYRQPLEHREEIIKLFNSGEYKVIVAMKILDEGIDVPGIERAIILANSGNPIEYIQRRGRILRKDGKKQDAEIFDILVFPWEVIPNYVSEADISMIRKEIKRIKEFTNSAMNPLEVMNKVSKFISVVDAR